jgi:hypothetical protein
LSEDSESYQAQSNEIIEESAHEKECSNRRQALPIGCQTEWVPGSLLAQASAGFRVRRSRRSTSTRS